MCYFGKNLIQIDFVTIKSSKITTFHPWMDILSPCLELLLFAVLRLCYTIIWDTLFFMVTLLYYMGLCSQCLGGKNTSTVSVLTIIIFLCNQKASFDSTNRINKGHNMCGNFSCSKNTLVGINVVYVVRRISDLPLIGYIINIFCNNGECGEGDVLHH